MQKYSRTRTCSLQVKPFFGLVSQWSNPAKLKISTSVSAFFSTIVLKLEKRQLSSIRKHLQRQVLSLNFFQLWNDFLKTTFSTFYNNSFFVPPFPAIVGVQRRRRRRCRRLTGKEGLQQISQQDWNLTSLPPNMHLVTETFSSDLISSLQQKNKKFFRVKIFFFLHQREIFFRLKIVLIVFQKVDFSSNRIKTETLASI